MTAEVDELVIDELDTELTGSHVTNPNVVHGDVCGKGKGLLQNTPPERHAASQVSITAQKIVKHAGTRGIGGIKRFRRDVQLLIGNVTVAYHALRLLQGFHRACHLTVYPFVVLVGKKYIITGTLQQSVLKVKNGRPFAWPFHNADRRMVERLHDGKGLVGGAIVGHNDLIALPYLREDGSKLVRYVFRPVISSDTY